MVIQIIDFLYVCLAIGFVVLIYYVVILIKRIIVTLDKLDIVLDDVKDTTGDVRNFKNQAKSTIFGGASMLLGLLTGKKKS